MDVLTLVSVIGSVAGLFFLFYEWGFSPQLETVRKILCDVKKAVSENSEELVEHGERLTKVETNQKLILKSVGLNPEYENEGGEK